jgi:hypothetical protein
MSLAFRKAKVYAKLLLITAVALVIALVVIFNRGNKVTIWFFREHKDINVLWVILCTAAGSIFCYWVGRTVFSVVRDMRKLGREAAMRAWEEEQRRLADKLAEQEKRIDQKRTQAIRDES